VRERAVLAEGIAMACAAGFVDTTPYQVLVGCVRMCVMCAHIHSARASSAAVFDRSLRPQTPQRTVASVTL
jgi:hypothetical protein